MTRHSARAWSTLSPSAQVSHPSLLHTHFPATPTICRHERGSASSRVKALGRSGFGTSERSNPAVGRVWGSRGLRPTGQGEVMDELDLDAVTIVAMRLSCALCGDTVRIAADEVDDLSEAGSVWWEGHVLPELTAVEAEHEGQVDEWVPVT